MDQQDGRGEIGYLYRKLLIELNFHLLLQGGGELQGNFKNFINYDFYESSENTKPIS